MVEQHGSPGSDQAQAEYMQQYDRRLRRMSNAANARIFGIQTSWSVALLAGAAVPLVVALGTATWVTSILGFVVVVASGAERIFARTVGAGQALDRLRRRLAREQRLYLTATGPYSEEGDQFKHFVQRTEDAITAYDTTAVQAHAEEAGAPQ